MAISMHSLRPTFIGPKSKTDFARSAVAAPTVLRWKVVGRSDSNEQIRVAATLTRLKVTVLDYGAGNLRSVMRALTVAGAEPKLSSSAREARQADLLVAPGQGAARDAMDNLRRLELAPVIVDHIRAGKPYLGICLGLQILLDRSDEHGGVECLGVAPGVVRRFSPGLKVPQIGWNDVAWRRNHACWRDAPTGSYFYFVHSYYAEVTDPGWVGGVTEYGVTFASVLQRENVCAFQFHPEKSGPIGLRLYENALAWAAAPTLAAR